MKSFPAICLIIFLVVLSVPSATFAHFLQRDKTIAVELHIDPFDNPRPGQKANLLFEFSDSTNTFSLQKCFCLVTISENQKEIFQHLLVPKTGDNQGASTSFVFPNKDTYQVEVLGVPLQLNSFEPFHIIWNFRVRLNPRPKEIDIPKTIVMYFFVLLGIFIAVGAVLFVSLRIHPPE